MRNYARNAGLSVLLFAPLLAACGQDSSGGNGDIVQIPSCGQQGQVLSTDSSGQLICKDLPAGTVSLPSCKPDTEAVTSDGKSLFCTNRNNESTDARSAIDQLNKLEMDVTEYNMKITSVTGAGGSRPLFVGVTTTTTKGRITSGAKVGLTAAAEVCAAQYAGSQMCTVYDMYYSLQAGKITQDINKAWVYQASWKNPAGARPTGTDDEEGDAGMNENCGTYTYPTGDQKWVGTAVAYQNIIYNGNKGLKFYSGSAQAPCSTALPIACCK